MCNPAAVAMGLTAASTAMQTYMQTQAAKAQERQARYNKQVAENAAIHAERVGRVEESFHRQKVSGLLGRQRAAIGASGVAVGEGSTAELEIDQIMIGEHEALMIRNNAAARALGYRQQADQFAMEEEAFDSMQGPILVGGLLSTGAGIAGTVKAAKTGE